MSNRIVKALEHGAQKVGKTLAEDAGKAVHKLYRQAGDNLRTVARNTRKADADLAGDLRKVLKDGESGSPHSPHAGGGGRGRTHGGEGPEPRRPTMRESANDPRSTAVPPNKRRCRSDPIDIASGEMVLEHEDVRLPGLLPLVLGRTHVSSYRCGGWFGPSWASTLDQRLELDDEGVVFAVEDGTLLVYPVPAPGEPVLPVEGPRLPLEWDPQLSPEMRISDPQRGLTYHFRRLEAGPELSGRASDGPHLPLHAVTDRNGNRIDVVYSAEGAPAEVRHSGGYRVAVDVEGRRITGYRLVGGAGQGGDVVGTGTGTGLVSFRYDGNGNLADVLDAAAVPLRLTYDEAGRITSWTGRNGFRFRYLYDRAGRCVQTRGDGGYLDALFAYDTEHMVTTVRDSLGQVTVYQLNDLGQTVSETDPLGGVVTSVWDRYDRLLTRTDQLGRTTSYAYDADGNPAAVTLPDGSTASAAFNDLHLPVQATQPDGTVWSWDYDERGNLIRTTAPDGARTHAAYSELGHLRTVTDAQGRTASYTTDAAGLVLSVTDPRGAVTRCTRDASGRLLSVTDALGGTTGYGWTADGRLAWRTDPEGGTERWNYNSRGDLTEYVSPVGNAVRHEYGPFGLPTARITPDGARYEFTHDTELRLTAVTNPDGLCWRYEFDAAGRLVGETDFNGRALRYAHDAAGQVVERVNGAGQSVSFVRDASGRAVSTRTGEGAETAFQYDGLGRLVRAVSPDSVVEFGYDAMGRIVRESVDGQVLTNEYDLVGRRVRRVTPTGAVSRWTYDAAGLPVTLSTGGGELAFQHDLLGRETARHFGRQVALSQAWDGAHRLTGQAVWSADAAVDGGYRQLQGRTYTYRSDGHPTEIADRLGGTRRFELDLAGRVTAVRAETWSETYAYDALGNLAHAEFPVVDDDSAAVQGGREHRGTLVRRAGRTSFDHDDQGRVVRIARRTLSGRERAWRYTWDAEDRLTQVVVPDGTVWRYRYDALGRRIAKVRMGADGGVAEQTLFSWDGTSLAEQRTVSAGVEKAVTWDWEPGTYRAAAQLERSWRCDEAGRKDAGWEDADREEVDRRFYAIVADLVGAPAELVTPDGEIAWRSPATLWGRRPATPDGAVDCPLRFPGQYHDDETGLHYNLARYYDPDTAGYLSPDPLGLAAAPNHHGYVGNPLWWMDPLGLKGRKITRIFDDSEYDKHSSRAGSSSKGEVSRAPSNGQAALDRSIDMDPNNPDVTRRLGVDHENNEIVVLDRHREVTDQHGNVTEYYHGHVQSRYPSKSVTQGDLTKLQRQGMIDNIKKQRVLPPPCEE